MSGDVPSTLATVWFGLIGLTFIIYLFLDGFTFSEGLSQPFLAKSERDRREMLGTVGPFWVANEVWIILGAGAIFAAFPLWYGTLMTALYPMFTLILLSLIGCGVAFEYRAEIGQPPLAHVLGRDGMGVQRAVCLFVGHDHGEHGARLTHWRGWALQGRRVGDD